MRKYLLSISLILLGLVFLVYGLYLKSRVVYTESEFKNQADLFTASFGQFIAKTERLTDQIGRDSKGILTSKDSVARREYFIKPLLEDQNLVRIGFLGTDYKILAFKEAGSILYTSDSTGEADVVLWKRFEKNKLVSQWHESFDETLENNTWFQTLLNTDKERTWFIGQEERGANSVGEFQAKPLYCGYTISMENAKYVVLLGYSSDLFPEELQVKRNQLVNLRLAINTRDGRRIELPPVSDKDQESLDDAIASHFEKFKALPSGTFNFRYQGENFWNSFGTHSERSGIENHVLTLSNHDMQVLLPSSNAKLSFWAGIVLLGTGIVMLGVRKRFFYKPNTMQVPSLELLLQDDENRYLEFKSSLRWDYRQEKVNPELEKVILKTLAAFGNTDGGILLIGVDDDKNIIGLEKDFQSLKKPNMDYFEIHLRNILHREMGVKYVSKYLRMDFDKDQQGKTVCKIKVLAAGEPMFLKFKNKNGISEEKFYVRSGNSSHEIRSIAEINDYINKKFRK